MFTQAYASAPNRAPTRACLLSGHYPSRHGIYTVVDPRQPAGSPWHKLLAARTAAALSPAVVTIAEALPDGGQATQFFGMRNLGRGRAGPVTPGGRGFQQVVFPERVAFGKDAYFNDVGHYLGDRLTEELLVFVAPNRDRPFFAYRADHAVNAPYDPSRIFRQSIGPRRRDDDRRNDPAHAATVEAVDQGVGRIVAELDRLRLTGPTVVILTSDNEGTAQFTAPLWGGTGQLYEGGIRVPLVVSRPGLTKPGTRCDAPVASIDIHPTLLDLAGVASPPGQP